ncbi:A/G-specific adenine glycosylase [Pusillimonas sp. SM2304]|uniref:A/G-specific adenine glycosylase n=1 Tax=Pusillimonas sp. SM2304 TaxID=3073241 RepID=UPI002875B9EF|nr:A/G-specific adenine glycosylase [Pusillimonas sp. SM2304]MDS1140319.1 A/G-specific adenine glycosylase [Pusillimonas sp. SM2304]
MLLNKTPQIAGFAGTITAWQKQHGRHHLPWQDTRDPYRIWLSEIMLQQTQVATVIGYYQRFLSRFPDIASLAAASQDEVMPYWAGLGYYARARNLHRCAQVICADWGGRFPGNADDIATLPGIGRSTAAAIAAFAYGERGPIMDGNVKRVFTRYFGIEGITSERATEQALWRTAEAVLDAAPDSLDMVAYTQGLMDLGSQCCTRSRPDCLLCPLQDRCYARAHGRQHELPTPRKKKASPERHCRMLVAHCGGHILLEQQASPGIWGGLWSLPLYDSDEDVQHACRRLGAGPAAQKMAGLLHVFTHFKLHIEPWYMRCDEAPLTETSPAQRWIALADLPATALPAPVKKILAGLFPAPD